MKRPSILPDVRTQSLPVLLAQPDGARSPCYSQTDNMRRFHDLPLWIF